MAESVHKQDFAIRNLPTRSVTLFPSRAQIIREIAGVSLKPGQNQIIIEGLTPTVDEHSIKVEGTGAATITDLSVQLVANKEIYEEIYPSDDEDSDDSEDEDETSKSEDEGIKTLREENKVMDRLLEDEVEKLKSVSARLAMLDKFSNSVEKSPPQDIGAVVSSYTNERVKMYNDGKLASEKAESLRESMSQNNRKISRLGEAAAKARAKVQKEKRKQQAAKDRKKAEAAKEKARIHAERAKFWPKQVYKVIISLDAPSGVTPATSRRNSIDSLVKVALPSETPATASDTSILGDINLSLSYITYAASWLPRYDLALNTVTQNGILDFQAELRNTTSETWRDAKIVLSTSQTSYAGLEDTIPVLQPWHVRLAKNNYNNGAALYSQSEQAQKVANKKSVPLNVQAPRNQLFGRDAGSVFKAEKKRKESGYAQQSYGNSYVPPDARMAPATYASAPGESLFSRVQPVARGGLFGNVVPRPSSAALFSAPGQSSSNVFGQSNSVQAPGRGFGTLDSIDDHTRVVGGGGRRSRTTRTLFLDSEAVVDEDRDQSEEDEAFDDATLNLPEADLQFEESSTSESGLTTTYDLPSVKTLVPSSSTIKHKIARLEFRSIVFSHILIPKLRDAAFLKARLRNASKLTLLKGTAGLTLDGSFLGQSTIPRCSAGESFSLPLGVDPSISVAYAKPTVRRSQSGIFSKEDCEVFTRTAVITNTKGNATVELSVLDQIPVSEDERLKVEVQIPRGLRIGGDAVSAGVGTGSNGSAPDVSSAGKARMGVYGDDGSAKSAGKWGSATAVAKKGGEVNWTVKINPGRGCKLVLEYEATYPGGETVIAVN